MFPFCISPFTNGKTNQTIQKSSCLRQELCSLLSKVRRWLLQTWKPWLWLKVLAAVLLPLGYPLGLKNDSITGRCCFQQDPADYSEVFLDQIDMKYSHLSYYCTVSHSCLLGFLCQNLFQGAILCSLTQYSFRRSIQRVTLTTRPSNCSVDFIASIRYQLS